MSNQQTSQWKVAANKNIKKLRAVSKVCGLAKSWQHWISENERKQASEPSGWSPCQEDSTEEPQKESKVEEDLQREVSTKVLPDPLTLPQELNKVEDANKSELTTTSSSITVKLMIKSIGPKDRNAGMKLLTQKIESEDAEEKYSPTRDTECSKIVSSQFQTEMPIEHQQKPGKEGYLEDKHTQLCADSKDRTRHSRNERETLNLDNEDSQNNSTKIYDGESPVKIKRPEILTYKKESAEARKINSLSKKYSPVGNLKSRWQNWASAHTDNQKLNPFSEYFDFEYSMSLRLQKGQDGYGRPKEGTKTAERAKRAEKHIHGEIADMCYVIRTMADPDQDGKTRVTFGELFDRYVRISDKVVGILLRARKHGKVHFEGEMLWQGQDDGVIITLLV
nr:actin-binding Rho-activating protein-like [Nerophis lumbriciformis]